jgi:hypothetical protein
MATAADGVELRWFLWPGLEAGGGVDGEKSLGSAGAALDVLRRRKGQRGVHPGRGGGSCGHGVARTKDDARGR